MATYRASPTYQAVAGVLNGEGIPFTVSPGRKHWRIKAQIGDLTRSIIISLSPSDRRAAANARAFTKRMIRAAA